MNNKFKINYLSRDFASIKDDLKGYAKRYYGNTFSDLSEASINSFLIDSVAYVGDMLSYYLDYQANESFLATAVEPKNIYKLSKELGYKKTFSSTATGIISLYVLIPSKDGVPDFSSAPNIRKGSALQSADGLRTYLLNEDIIIDSEIIGNKYVVAQTNAVGNPTYFAVKVEAPIISGVIKVSNITVGDFKKFNKIFLPDITTVEIISVVDSDGNEYYEVPNLSQNIVYRSYVNDENSSGVKYSLRTVSAQRRYVFDVDVTVPYLMFGGKQYRPDDDLTINPVAEPGKFVLERYNTDYLSEDYFEPNRLLNGDQFGIGPDNTTLTITYRSNTNGNNNAATGDIVKISNLEYNFKNTLVSIDTQNTIINSIQVVNEAPVVGDGLDISYDELKDLSGMIYQAQNRAVTAKDYETLTYMLPSKYGSIKRAKAERDPDSVKNNINLYVICQDSVGLLQKPNLKIKDNLKYWLSGYKMITDTVDILDAKIINLGIDFQIVVDPNASKAETLDLVKRQLAFVFSAKAQIGQNFNKLDVLREIRKIKAVLDITALNIKNLTGIEYSPTGFNIKQNSSPDENIIYIPKNAIYEIRYPTTDINGTTL
jgi:hypothetical protein